MKNKISAYSLLMFLMLTLGGTLSLKAQNKGERATENRTEMNVHLEKDRRVEIPNTVLPDKLTAHIYNAYEDAEIIEAWKWVSDEGEIESYEVHVEKKGLDIRLKYDADGEPVKLEKSQPQGNSSPK